MKRIEGIDAKPQHFQEDVPQQALDAMPTFRKMFIASVGAASARGQEEALDLQQIVLKLRVVNSDGDHVDLEEAQIKMLTKKVEENPQQYAAFFLAQMFQKLKDAKEPPKEK